MILGKIREGAYGYTLYISDRYPFFADRFCIQPTTTAMRIQIHEDLNAVPDPDPPK